MCLDCGCMQPDNTHDDARHITYGDLAAAAALSGISPKKAAKNIVATLKASKDAKGSAERTLKQGPGSDPAPEPRSKNSAKVERTSRPPSVARSVPPIAVVWHQPGDLDTD